MVTNIKLPNITTVYIVGAVAALALVAYYVKKNGVQGATFNLADAGVGAAVDAVNGIVSGTVVGIGKQVGIPATNVDECTRCKRAGDAWGASFACPAGDYLSWLWAGKPRNV